MLTVFLYIIIPKGFFPVQDTGVIQGISQAPPTISSQAMAEKQQELAKVVLEDPAVESLSSFIGADGTNITTNSGRMSINLKPLDQRKISASDLIRRLKPRLDQVQGIQLFMEPVQNITVDDRVSRTQYQYTLEDSDANELNVWTNRFVDRLKKLPELEDVATDQQPGGLAVSLVIDRVTASRLGIAPATIDNTLYDAFGQRQISTMYTQVNQYHVVLESEPQFQKDPNKLNHLYIQSNASSGASGRRSLFLFRVFRIVVRGLERADRLGALHSIGKYAHSSRERAFGEHLHFDVQQGSSFRRQHQFGHEQRRAAQRFRAL